MRARALVFLLAAVLLLAAGCGKRANSPGAHTAAPTTHHIGEPVTLTVAVSGSDALVDMQRRINDELARDPLLTVVTIETVPFPQMSMQSIEQNAALLTESGPDIVVLSAGWARLLWPTGALYPLDEAITRHTSLNEHWRTVYPGAVESSTYDGIVFSAPRSLDVSGILYNVEYVANAGVTIEPDWDWNDMLTLGQRLEEIVHAALAASDDPGLRARARNPDQYAGIVLCTQTSCWIPFIWSNGEEYGGSQQPAALDWLETEVQRGSLSYHPAAEFMFRRGAAAMKPGYLADLATLNTDALTTAFAPFPRSPYTGQSVSSLDGTVYVVNARSQHIAAALDFLAASLSPRGQSITAKHTQGLPVRPDAEVPSLPGWPDPEVIRTVAASARPPRFASADADTSIIASSPPGAPLPLPPSYQGEIIIAEGDAIPGDFFGSGTTRRPGAQEPPSEAWSEKGGVEIVFRSNTSELRPFVEEFNRSQDDIYVHLIYTDKSTSRYEDSVEAGIASGTYDVIDLPTGSLSRLIESGSLVPLDRFLSLSPIDRSYDGGALDQARVEGTLYWLPLERTMSLIIVRAEAWERSGFEFPRAGWTWEEYLSWATKMTDPEARQYGARHESGIWLRIAHQREIDLWAYPYPQMADDLRLAKELYNLYPHRDEESTGWLEVMEDVLRGDALSTIQTTGLIDQALRTIRAEHPTLYLPEPVTDVTRPVVIGSLGKKVGIAATSKRQQEAFTFIAWLIEQNERVALHPERIDKGLLPLRMTPRAVEAIEDRYGPEAGTLFAGAFVVPPTPDHALAMQVYPLVKEYMTGRTTLDHTLDRIAAATGRDID